MELEIGTLSVGVGAGVLIRKRNPSRRYLIVAVDNPTTSFWLWPVQETQHFGLGPIEGTSFVSIHRAVYPDLCEGDWYMTASVGCSAHWIDAYDT